MVLGSGLPETAITVGETMPNIKVNTKIQAINLISNTGTELEIDQETLERWNKALAEWWNVQLEMDKLIQGRTKDAVQ